MKTTKSAWQKFVIQLLVIPAFLLLGVFAVNYTVDPQWTFPHEAEWARYQRGFDERQQKTNALVYLSSERDGLVLGNSRVTYMNPGNFPGRAFNFASSSMNPDEYLPFAQFLAERSGSDPDRIVLGESFVATNANAPQTAHAPTAYFERATTPLYRYRSLISLDLLSQSIKILRRNRKGEKHQAYVREGDDVSYKRMSLPRPPEQLSRLIKANLSVYRKKAYGRFNYRSQAAHYEALRARFPKAQFLVYTTPVTAHLLRLLVELKLVDTYLEWLKDLVNSWGSVWHFMTFNTVSNDETYFADAHHHSPQVTRWISDRLLGQTRPDAPPDFGVLLTRENIESQLKAMEHNMRSNTPSPKP